MLPPLADAPPTAALVFVPWLLQEGAQASTNNPQTHCVRNNLNSGRSELHDGRIAAQQL